jgi:hypothetical protein
MVGACKVGDFRRSHHVLSLDSNCSTLRKVENSEEDSKNEMKYVWNELKPLEYLYGGGR